MSEDIHLKYLTISPHDQLWGMAVNSLGFQQVAPGKPYPPSGHPSRYLFSKEGGRILDEYQLLYITHGRGRFRSASLPHPLSIKQGSLFLLFPGEWHSYAPDPATGWKEYWIGFKGEQIRRWEHNGFFAKDNPLWNIGLHSDIVDLYTDAMETAREQCAGFQQRLSGVLVHLMSLAWYYRRNVAFSEVADKMNQAKILIAEQYRTITPEDLSRQLCLGYSNFRRIFKEYTGLAPSQYIQQIRIHRTKEMLTNTSLPIKQVAYEMGYENEDYFFTAFRRVIGMTPGEYREHTQGGHTRKK